MIARPLTGQLLEPESPRPGAAIAALRRMRHWRLRPSVVGAVAMLSVVAAITFVYPFFPSYDPFAQNLANGLLPPFQQAAHPLGTDTLGRDILSRIALATRTSMLIAGSALLLNIVIGVSLGLAAGYFRGVLDTVVMGVADLQLSLPILILLVMIVAVLGPSAQLLAIVLGLSFWMGYARVSRIVALGLRNREFVLAARTQGASAFWILRKHILAEVLPVITIMASFDLGVRVILESSLSYLGLGVKPPTPTLGAMIADGQQMLQTAPWLCLVPGLAIFLLVGGVQILSQRFTAEGGIRFDGTETGTGQG